MNLPNLPLILLPGMLNDHRLWAAQVAALEGAHAITIPDIASDDCLERMAKSLLAQLPERFVLGGLSMGGYLALEMMEQLRKSGESKRVAGLMLVATSARADAPGQTRVRRGLIQLARKGTFKGVTPKLLPTLIHKAHLDNAPMTQTIFEMADAVGVEGFIRQETAVMLRRDHVAMLESITCPTLIICGEADQRTPPECSEELAAHISNAEFHLLSECGHLPPLEQPAHTTRLMQDFLARL